MINGEIRACLPLPRDADLAGACINLTLAWRLVTAHCVKAADKSRKLIKFLGFALSIVLRRPDAGRHPGEFKR